MIVFKLQALSYFQHYYSDKILNKIMVSVVVLCNTVMTVGVCGDTYYVSEICTGLQCHT
jgi:hypothetical protein